MVLSRTGTRTLDIVAQVGCASACLGSLGFIIAAQRKAQDFVPAACCSPAATQVRTLVGHMQLFGHRGASALAPENTAASFRIALERGADGVECDLQRLQDEVVVLHDDTLRRTSPNCEKGLLDAPIESLRHSQVQNVDVGSWFSSEFRSERLLTFYEFLELVAKHKGACFVEVKGGDFQVVPQVVSQARATSLDASRIIFIGFDIKLMQAIKQAAPEFKCFGITFVKVTWFSWIAERTALAFAKRCIEAGLDGADFNAHPNVVTKRVVEELHSSGLFCAVWAFRAPASNDRSDIWTLMASRGVDYFTSNCPEESFAWWQQHRQQHDNKLEST
mmetsp:Transcript_46809/g.85708  ORF Transcript_46809/g.85708 Transcript_46809/m.85708 type:complete len:333 (+) Transcript_46809:54-1052(+)